MVVAKRQRANCWAAWPSQLISAFLILGSGASARMRGCGRDDNDMRHIDRGVTQTRVAGRGVRFAFLRLENFHRRRALRLPARHAQ